MVYIPPHTSYELYPAPPAFLLSPNEKTVTNNEKTVTNDLEDHARAYTLTVWIVFDRHAEATGFFCSAAVYDGSLRSNYNQPVSHPKRNCITKFEQGTLDSVKTTKIYHYEK